MSRGNSGKLWFIATRSLAGEERIRQGAIEVMPWCKAQDDRCWRTQEKARLGGPFAVPRGALLGVFDFDDFAALVEATLGAGAMRHFLPVAVGALGKRVSREVVVRTAVAGAGFRVSPFWIRHCLFLYIAGRNASSKLIAFQLIAQTAKGIPARIGLYLFAGARPGIQVASASRAEALAIILAEGPVRSL